MLLICLVASVALLASSPGYRPLSHFVMEGGGFSTPVQADMPSRIPAVRPLSYLPDEAPRRDCSALRRIGASAALLLRTPPLPYGDRQPAAVRARGCCAPRRSSD